MLFSKAVDEEQKDTEFFIELYEKYRLAMYKIALNYVKDSHAAEDIVQDTTLRLFERKDRLKKLKDGALTSYIVFTTKSVTKNYLRKQNVEMQYFETVDISDLEFKAADTAPQPEEAAIISVAFGKVWDTLPASTRELLVCKHIVGLNDKEIAEQLGCSPDSVRMMLTRARRQLIEVAEKGGYVHESE